MENEFKELEQLDNKGYDITLKQRDGEVIINIGRKPNNILNYM